MSSRSVLLCGALLAFSTMGTAVAENGGLTVIEAQRVITVTGEEYSPGMVVIEDGKITLVGSNLEVPAGAKRIRARGETVMPGLILARTRHGLTSAAAAPPSFPRGPGGRRFGPRPRGGGGRSGVHCDAKALDELHPGEIDHRPLLRGGFVAAGYVPSGSGFPGQAAVIGLGNEDEIRVLKDGAYLPVTFNSNARDGGTVKSAFDSARKEIEKVKKAKEEWEKKQAEAKKKAEAEAKKAEGEKAQETKGKDSGKEPAKDGNKPSKEKPKEPDVFKAPKIAAAVAPLVDILEKKKDALPLVFQIGGAGNYRHLEKALENLKEVEEQERHRNVQMVPSSSTEQRALVETLGERKTTVITMPSLSSLPQTRMQINLPAELARAGCKVVFLPTSDSETEFRRMLARVADLVRSGMSRGDALKALTLNPAQFLGIGERNGSIEKDRVADLIFLDGDPFAAATEVTRTMINGKVVWEREAQ